MLVAAFARFYGMTPVAVLAMGTVLWLELLDRMGRLERAEAALKKTKEKISVIRTEFLDVCKSVAPTDAQCRYSSDSEYQRGARDLLKAMAGSVLKCFEEIEASINPK